MSRRSYIVARNRILVLLCVTTAIIFPVVCPSAVFSQEWAVNSDLNPGGGATAAPTNRTPYSPKWPAGAAERACSAKSVDPASYC